MGKVALDLQLKYLDFTNRGWTRVILDDSQGRSRHTLVDVNQDGHPDFFVKETAEGRALSALDMKGDGVRYLKKFNEDERIKLLSEISDWKFNSARWKEIEPDLKIVSIGHPLYLGYLEIGMQLYCSPAVQALVVTKKEGLATVGKEIIQVRKKGEEIVHPNFTIRIESKSKPPICSNVNGV